MCTVAISGDHDIRNVIHKGNEWLGKKSRVGQKKNSL